MNSKLRFVNRFFLFDATSLLSMYKYYFMNKKLLFVVCVLVSVISISQVESGLVAKYSFNTGTAIDEVGVNDGTVNGAVTTSDRFGNPNMAFNFINGDYITLPDAAVLKSDTMTVSLWVKIDSIAPSNVGTNYIYSVVNSTTNAYFAAFSMSSYSANSNYLCVSQNGPSESSLGFSTNPSTGSWQHYVMAIDNDSIWMYIDGQLQWSYLKDFVVTYSSDSVYIGISGNTTYYGNLNGDVDDIRVYNHVLTQVQVDSLFNEQDPLLGAGINDATSFDFQIYPNPASTELTILSDVPTEFRIVDMQGTVIKTGIIQQSAYIDISFLANGIYFILTQNGQAAKFIKQ